MTGKVPKQNRINKKSDPYFRSYLIYLPSETLYFEITPHLTTRVITIPRTGRGRVNRGVGDMSPPTLKSRGPPMYWSPPVTTTFMLIGWSPPYIHTIVPMPLLTGVVISYHCYLTYAYITSTTRSMRL